MLGAFGQIILAIIVLGLICWAYIKLIPYAKLDGFFATLLHVVVVIAVTIAALWYIILPLFSILFGMLGGGGFGGGFHAQVQFRH